MKPPIYLDYNATTPLAQEVQEAMRPFLETGFGNPSSSHWYGLQAKKALERSRAQVASLINASADEIIFTSGGSEANNLAIKGIFGDTTAGSHIIVSRIEHPAVSDICHFLESQGARVTRIGVDRYGIVDLKELQDAITPNTKLISIMHANNEIGTLQPIEKISKIAKTAGILLHTDAAQSVGKTPVDVRSLDVDLLSIAGHKFYGPKGVGALYIKRGTKVEKQIHGAAHEQNLRAGTENVLLAVGLGAACTLAEQTLSERIEHSRALRDSLWESIHENIEGAFQNGHPELRLSNTLSITFPGVEVQTLLAELDSVAASAGAACHADDVIISPTLSAIGLRDEEALSTVRFSTGAFLSAQEVDSASSLIVEAVERLGGVQTSESQAPHTADVKLTRYTHGLGCACKLRPQALEKVLANIQTQAAPKEALIGFDQADDAAAYQINDTQCIVQSVDFFTPIVDNPYDFGAISAANALSDLYAMGAKPLFALNVVGFPTNRLPLEVLGEILKGANEKAQQAGVFILGGHTVEDLEPKFGMSVTGICHPEELWQNQGAQEGDALILTKPIGLGILTTAMKQGSCSATDEKLAISLMSELNARAAEVARHFSVHSCTDITGFGLLGHLREMMLASSCTAELQLSDVPILDAARALAFDGVMPGGTINNLEFVQPSIKFAENIERNDQLLLADAQTSGGLLLAVPESESHQIISELQEVCPFGVSLIGRVIAQEEHTVEVF